MKNKKKHTSNTSNVLFEFEVIKFLYIFHVLSFLCLKHTSNTSNVSYLYNK